MDQKLKKRMAFALIMGIITTCIISFVLVAVNMGFTTNFLYAWFKSWIIAYIVVIPAIIFVAPILENKINKYFDPV